MLMIFLMAILSLDLLHYSSQNRTSTSIEPRSSHGHKYLMSNEIRHSNSTVRISTPKSNHKKTSTSGSGKKAKKKIIVRRRKVPRNDSQSVASVPAKLSSKRPTPKSDTIMPFYAAQPMVAAAQPMVASAQPMAASAQPMATAFDLSYHQPIFENYNPLVNGILNMNEQPLPMQSNPAIAQQMPMPILQPIVEPIPFKQIDPQHFQAVPPPGVQKIPLLDPFNVLKPRKPVRIAGKPKFYPVVRAMPQLTTVSPPITVTHIYKYEETNSGLRLPFENDDLADFPAISVALNDHLHDRANEIARLRGMMTPPKLHQQPIYYNMPVVELSTVPPATYTDPELDIIHKFNEAIKLQNAQQEETPSQDEEQPVADEEDSKETQDNTAYSDDDVKKALKYIQTLKKDKPKPNRGSKKFDTEKSQNKRRNKGKKESSIESLEDDEPEKSKKSNKHKSPDFSAEDENFTVMSFDELEGDESNKKVVKSKKKMAKVDTTDSGSKADSINDQIGYQETQIVPSLDHEDAQEYSPPPDFSQNANLGGESNEDRIEFQMHGLRGPETYKFGYDTGKGENRQFRYEERDPDGRVKGHFGYYDNNGKLQVFNYEADPEHGYHLEQANRK